MKTKQPVAILGATGMVGQRLITLLHRHPWFESKELVASAESTGKRYGDTVNWVAPDDLPEEVAGRTLSNPGQAIDSRIVFSCLGDEAASSLEPLLAGRGHLVVSNSSAFRMDPQVPLIIPEINHQDIELVRGQPWARTGGAIVTNPNCCVAGLALVLAPLHREFGLAAVTVITMQALSGAGLTGLSALEMAGDLVPLIPGEEEKIASEPQRIMQTKIPISVAAHRVPVVDGHTMTVFLRFRSRARLSAVTETLRNFRAPEEVARLPSCPDRPLSCHRRRDRPRPRLDAPRGNGMTVQVGPLQPDPVYDARLTVVVHNLVRGAAGTALLNAELLVANPPLYHMTSDKTSIKRSISSSVL